MDGRKCLRQNLLACVCLSGKALALDPVCTAGYVEANITNGQPSQEEKKYGAEHPMWLVSGHNYLGASRQVSRSPACPSSCSVARGAPRASACLQARAGRGVP